MQVYNCDETGFSGKEASRQKVVGVKRSHTYQQRVTTADHVTAHLCVSADGRFLPTMVIFKGSLPHRDYKDGVPSKWTYATSESGYMDGELFAEWFERVFIPNCGQERPVLLCMDNHESHISLSVVQNAQKHGIILVGFPAHTTHLLQPLDVKIMGPLKERFSAMSNKLGFASKNLVIGKAKFPIVLNYAIDRTAPSSVKEAFKCAGIFPVNKDAIDPSQIVPALFERKQGPDGKDVETLSVTCETCGSFLTNPLVAQGLIPEALSDILIPPPGKPAQEKKRKIVAEGRLLSGDKMLELLKEKEELEEKKKQEKEERKLKREIRKEEKQKENERKEKRKMEKIQKNEENKKSKKVKKLGKRELQTETVQVENNQRNEGRLDSVMYTCGVCHVRGRVSDEGKGINWFGCDDHMCASGTGWFHEACLSDQEKDLIAESLQDETVYFYCHFCCPGLYDEE